MSIPPASPRCLDFFGTRLVIKRLPGGLPGDAGQPPFRKSDQGVGFTRAITEVPDASRQRPPGAGVPGSGQCRLFGTLAGYKDQDCNDDRLSS
jgi:hypothetical protein